jgi:hypothetical protein
LKALLVAPALPLAVLLIVPLRLETNRVQATLSTALGFPVRVEATSLTISPWPALELRGVSGQADAVPWLPLSLSVDRIEAGLLSSARERTGDLPLDWAELGGIRASAGPLSLRGGALSLDGADGALELKGRALGAHGGWLEATGWLPDPARRSGPLRLYVSDLVVPLPSPSLHSVGVGRRTLGFGGVVTLERSGAESEELDLELRIRGLRANSAGEWLRGSLRGRSVRQDGRFLPGTRLSADVELRDMGGARSLYAVHGPVRAVAAVVGSPGSLQVDADLRDVRIRLGEVFEKPVGERARARIRARLEQGELSSVHAEITTRDLRIHAERSAADPAEEWRVRTSRVSLARLRKRIPALQEAGWAIDGDVTLSGRWSPGRGLRGTLDFRNVELARIGARFVSLSADYAGGTLRFRCPELRVGGQAIELSGVLERGPEPGVARMRLDGRTHALDLERLAGALGPLWSGSSERLGADDATEWERVAIPVVRTLRSHPGVLEHLLIESARLKIGRVSGLGLEARDAEVSLRLLNRVLRIEHRHKSSGPAAGFDIDLDSWFPRLAETS